jgi:Predicted AAA-ATPase/PD-(D/E)XK nuclease superfamily
MQKRKLPIGIQSLSEIINGGYYYADKTPHIHRLIEQGKYYFLSRPRRFGKSLFIDTLKELFEGNKPLFKGLFIHDKWDWAKKYPVIQLSFGNGIVTSRVALDERIHEIINENAKRLKVSLNSTSIPGRFKELIETAYQQHGDQVIMLVDEYDKPILDNITNPDAAIETREGLKNFYSVIKDSDKNIKFCMLTGVSKFSKVSLFSGLNNLRDITLSTEYSAICGYTDTDIDTVFAPELTGLDREEIRRWYNGYNWGGESVYNPFDVLLLLQERTFKPYWFETGTPTFLINLLRDRNFFTPKLDALQTSAALISQFDVDVISTEALLFQSGYLTLKSVDEYSPGKWLYTLTYPNLEVQSSLNEVLLPALGVGAEVALLNGIQILKALRTLDFDYLKTQLQSLFASIPHDWYRNNNTANYEGHYASIFYSHFAALGLDISVEEAVLTGKIDMALEFNQCVFLFEFKVVADQPEGTALKQLQERNYAEKYRAKQSSIYLIGVEFSKTQKQIVAFEVVRA